MKYGHCKIAIPLFNHLEHRLVVSILDSLKHSFALVVLLCPLRLVLPWALKLARVYRPHTLSFLLSFRLGLFVHLFQSTKFSTRLCFVCRR
jgi:hypothetical protein